MIHKVNCFFKGEQNSIIMLKENMYIHHIIVKSNYLNDSFNQSLSEYLKDDIQSADLIDNGREFHA